MSRFVNLEFSEQHAESNQQGVVRDEAFYFSAARGAFENGEFEPALRYYARVLEFNPQNAAAWTGQVRALIELNEPHEAKVWADKSLERFPREPELLAAKAVALGRCGDLDAALAFSDAAIEERGDTPYIWLARADVLLAREEKRAEFCLQKALMLAPKDWFVTWLAARVRFFYKEFSAALQLARQALEFDAGRWNVWLLAGQCQQRLGMVAHATASFTQARQLNPQSLEVQRALTRLSGTGVWARLGGWWREQFQK